MKHWWNGNDRGNPKFSEKICPRATVSNTDSTWSNPRSRLQVRDQALAPLHGQTEAKVEDGLDISGS